MTTVSVPSNATAVMENMHPSLSLSDPCRDQCRVGDYSPWRDLHQCEARYTDGGLKTLLSKVLPISD